MNTYSTFNKALANISYFVFERKPMHDFKFVSNSFQSLAPLHEIWFFVNILLIRGWWYVNEEDKLNSDFIFFINIPPTMKKLNS